MLTRGYLIGQIVDDLSSIAHQAKQRARLHLFDVHTHVEEFVKEVLNRALDLSLKNLNTENANNPGLDLGDSARGWAFQVTADKSTAKVRDTLENIGSEQRKTYPNIRILVIGEKQGSYSFAGEPFASAGFTPEMVWDFNDVCARVMSLPIDTLMDLGAYVSGETRRVRVELEIPDQDGRFPTGIEDQIEALPRPRLSDASKMAAHFASKGNPIERHKAEEALAELSATLAALPRLTREVFRFMVERRDNDLVGRYQDLRISEPKLRRIYRGEDLDGDLALLSESHLLDLSEPDDTGRPPYWRIILPGRKDSFNLLFIEYVADQALDLRRALVTLDFSDF